MVLTALLTGNRSSRLFQRLVVQDQTASNISSSLGPGDLFPRLFSISVSIQSCTETDQIEKAIYDELETLARIPPSKKELQRIRNQISAGQIRRLSGNFGLATQLAHSTSQFGNWKHSFDLSQKLKEVQPQMISEVIKKFLTRNNRTVALLTPIDSCVR
jgi:zinc protease